MHPGAAPFQSTLYFLSKQIFQNNHIHHYNNVHYTICSCYKLVGFHTIYQTSEIGFSSDILSEFQNRGKENTNLVF